VFANELALLVSGLRLETVVEQIECLGVGSLVGQGKGIQVDGLLEVDGQIATGALRGAYEGVVVGGGNERGAALPV